MQDAADDVGRRPRRPDRPGDRRPGDGRARHRRREGARAVPADGPRQDGRARPTSTTSSRQKYGDSNGFQAGSTFKAFVLAAAIKQGIPLTRRSTSPPTIDDPDDRVPRPATATLRQRPTCWSPDNSTGAGTFNLYTRHPAVGEHLLRPARAADRPVRALPAGPGDGHRPDRPGDRERVPSFTLGVAERQPAGDGRGLRHLRRPRPALRPAAGRPRSTDSDGQRAQGVPRAVQPGDRRRRPPTPSTTSCAACRSPAASATTTASALDQPSAGKTGTTRRQHGGVVRRLHPEPRHRRDDRRRQRARPLDHAERPDRRRQLHRRSAFGSTFAGPMWGDAMHGDPALAARRRTSRRPTGDDDRRRARPRCPTCRR